MSIDRFLTHRVSLLRRVGVYDEEGDPVVDEYNVPTAAVQTTTGIAASIQPRSARERADITQAGVAVSDHRIYVRPLAISTADIILHDPDACPMRTDLPAGRYEIVAVPDAAGAGRHLELAAKLVSAPGHAYDTPVGEGGS